MNTIYELVYFSEAGNNIQKGEINSISKTSDKNNSDLAITRLLVFNNNEFIQILEGDKKAVKSLYKKIKKDKRHQIPHILFEGFKDKRDFPQWSMNFFLNEDISLDNINMQFNLKNLTAFAEL